MLLKGASQKNKKSAKKLRKGTEKKTGLENGPGAICQDNEAKLQSKGKRGKLYFLVGRTTKTFGHGGGPQTTPEHMNNSVKDQNRKKEEKKLGTTEKANRPFE